MIPTVVLTPADLLFVSDGKFTVWVGVTVSVTVIVGDCVVGALVYFIGSHLRRGLKSPQWAWLTCCERDNDPYTLLSQCHMYSTCTFVFGFHMRCITDSEIKKSLCLNPRKVQLLSVLMWFPSKSKSCIEGWTRFQSLAGIHRGKSLKVPDTHKKIAALAQTATKEETRHYESIRAPDRVAFSTVETGGLIKMEICRKTMVTYNNIILNPNSSLKSNQIYPSCLPGEQIGHTTHIHLAGSCTVEDKVYTIFTIF